MSKLISQILNFSILAAFIFIFIGPTILIKIRDHVDDKKEKQKIRYVRIKLEVNQCNKCGYTKDYVKRLEIYLQVTQECILLYDASDHGPKMALMILRSLKESIANMSNKLLEPDAHERVILSQIIKDFRRGFGHMDS